MTTGALGRGFVEGNMYVHTLKHYSKLLDERRFYLYMKATIFHRKPDQLETSQLLLQAGRSERNTPSPNDRNPTGLMEVTVARLGHFG